jgi:ribosomal protein S18 acetylase RimI-like enzyme
MAHFGLAEDMTCRQAVWTGGKIEYEPELDIVPADDEAMKVIWQHYKVITEEDLWRVKDNGNLFCGYTKGCLAGFIGQHLEGNMGLLHVLPEFRRRGYAEELEAFMINRITGQGRVPFAHILHDNTPSLALQRKLGLNLSEGFVYWAF